MDERRRAGRPEPVLTFTDRQIVWVLATVATALYAFATKMRLTERPWGDEPHYLVMSIALGKYHTFDLTRAYASFDYAAFYPEELDPHVFAGPGGVMVPLHNFGGPLLWTVPFGIWGRPGAAAVVVLASVLTVVTVHGLLRELGIVRAYAAIVTGLFVVGSPLYMYASMQFVEPFGALFVSYAVRVLVSPRPSRVRVALASAGLGYLPWVHGRFTLFTVILGFLLIARVDRVDRSGQSDRVDRSGQSGRRGATGRRAVLAYLPAVVPMAVLVLALELFNLTRYGSLSPAPGNANYGDGLLQIAPQTGLAGLLFDRQFGLLSHFPLLILAVPGMLLAGRRRAEPSAHLVLLAVIVPYVVAVSTFRYWWAGFSPPGRLLAVLAPLLAYYVAVLLQRLHGRIVLIAAMLTTAFGFMVSVTGDVYTVARFSESGGAGVDPVFAWLGERAHLQSVPGWLPAVRVTPASGSYLPWYLAFAGFVGLVWWWGRRAPADRVPVRPLLTLFPALRPLLTPVPVAGPTPDAAAGRRTVAPHADLGWLDDQPAAVRPDAVRPAAVRPDAVRPDAVTPAGRREPEGTPSSARTDPD